MRLKEVLVGLMVGVPMFYLVATEAAKPPKPHKTTQRPAMPGLKPRLAIFFYSPMQQESDALYAIIQSLKNPPFSAREQRGAFIDTIDGMDPSELPFFLSMNLWNQRSGTETNGRLEPAVLGASMTNCQASELGGYAEALSQGKILVCLDVHSADNQFILQKVLLLSEPETVETSISDLILSSEKEAWEKLRIVKTASVK